MRDNNTVDFRMYAAVTALRQQQHNLEETIAHLLELTLSQPESKLREELLEDISCLDSAVNLMRQALDSVVPERRDCRYDLRSRCND